MLGWGCTCELGVYINSEVEIFKKEIAPVTLWCEWCARCVYIYIVWNSGGVLWTHSAVGWMGLLILQ